MQTKFFAALLGCCTLTAAIASDRPTALVDFHDFQGQYDLADGCQLTIMQRDHRLMMQIEDQPAAELIAIGSAAFMSRSGDLRLEFVQYPNGNVPAVRVIAHATPRQPACLHPAPASSKVAALVAPVPAPDSLLRSRRY